MWTRRIIAFCLLCTASLACCEESVFQNGPQATQVLSEGAGEGPAWHPKHGLFCSGPEGITRLGKDGKAVLFLPDAGSNGLLFDSNGSLLICQPKYRRFGRLDVETKQLTVITDRYDGARYNTPNDITLDSKGRIYFSDPRYGERDSMEMSDANKKLVEGVYRVDSDGSVTRIITHEVDRPNGLLITPDDRLLYVADNNNDTVGGARKLWRFNLLPNGEVDKASQKLIFDWHPGRGPDGMVSDVKGNLYVAAGRSKPVPPYETADKFKGGVYVFSPQGELLEVVPIPNDEVTNCTFGGPDLKTLFITAGGTLWKIKTKSPGALRYP